MRYPIITISAFAYIANPAEISASVSVVVGSVTFRGTSAAYVAAINPGLQAVNLAGNPQPGVAF